MTEQLRSSSLIAESARLTRHCTRKRLIDDDLPLCKFSTGGGLPPSPWHYKDMRWALWKSPEKKSHPPPALAAITKCRIPIIIIIIIIIRRRQEEAGRTRTYLRVIMRGGWWDVICCCCFFCLLCSTCSTFFPPGIFCRPTQQTSFVYLSVSISTCKTENVWLDALLLVRVEIQARECFFFSFFTHSTWDREQRACLAGFLWAQLEYRWAPAWVPAPALAQHVAAVGCCPCSRDSASPHPAAILAAASAAASLLAPALAAHPVVAATMAADYPPPSSRVALSKTSPSPPPPPPPPPPQAPPLFSSRLQNTNNSRALQGLGSCKGITNWRDLARETEGRETE